MNISLSYSIVPGGLYGGCPALFLKQGDAEVDLMGLIRTLRESSQTLNMKLRLLIINNTETGFNKDDYPNLNDISAILPDWTIATMSYGNSLPTFVKTASYRIAVINNDPWLEYPANEIWFEPEASLTEPSVGQQNLKSSRFIKVTSRITLSDAIKFVQATQLLWGIINQPKKTIEVEIL